MRIRISALWLIWHDFYLLPSVWLETILFVCCPKCRTLYNMEGRVCSAGLIGLPGLDCELVCMSLFKIQASQGSIILGVQLGQDQTYYTCAPQTRYRGVSWAWANSELTWNPIFLAGNSGSGLGFEAWVKFRWSWAPAWYLNCAYESELHIRPI